MGRRQVEIREKTKVNSSRGHESSSSVFRRLIYDICATSTRAETGRLRINRLLQVNLKRAWWASTKEEAILKSMHASVHRGYSGLKAHKDWTEEQWSSVLWSKESKISIFGTDGSSIHLLTSSWRSQPAVSYASYEASIECYDMGLHVSYGYGLVEWLWGDGKWHKYRD